MLAFKQIRDKTPSITRAEAQFVSHVRGWGEKLTTLTDAQLGESLADMLERYQKAPERERKLGEPLSVRAFAIVNEAFQRTLRIALYDSQILAARARAEGSLIELPTGEGKTFVAPVVAYWLLVCGHAQVHVHTANDFLAERDARMLDPVYKLLGVTLSVALPWQPADVRQRCYGFQVVYGAYGSFVLDSLRDNTARAKGKLLQWQGLKNTAAIVDEADSALIDDARLPAVLYASGGTPPRSLQTLAHDIAPALVRCESEAQRTLATSGLVAIASEGQATREREALKRELESAGFAASGDYYLDGTSQIAVLTDRGYARAEELLVKHSLLAPDEAKYGERHQELLRALVWAITARELFHRGVQYEIVGTDD
jgi:preprotein translocase subunit SecA